MCAISGYLSISTLGSYQQEYSFTTIPRVERMLHHARHRGLDEIGYCSSVCGNLGLGHSRLSIIAPENGLQPIVSPDKRYVLICNGEIFNHRELRHRCKDLGYQFTTHSDCEVIIPLFSEYGRKSLDDINGQFAFALWDNLKQRLYLGRDRVGILPLFYQIIGDKLFFASEIKSLLAANTQAPKADLKTLKQIFHFWGPLEGHTAFEGIKQVKPGHMLTIDHSGFDEFQYWDWRFPERGQHESNRALAKTQFSSLFDDAVKLRNEADVPVAAFLSGGLDSSSVIASSCSQGFNPHSYSIRFSESSQHDESHFQQLLSEQLTLPNCSINCTPETLADAFTQAIWHTESPILRTAPTPLMQLAEQVHNDGYKVALTGEGADEILGGYDIFKETKIRQFWSRARTSKVRPELFNRLYPYMKGSLASGRYLKQFFSIGLDNPEQPFFSHLPRWQTTQACQQFFSDDLLLELSDYHPEEDLLETLPSEFESWHWLNRSQYLEAHTLLSSYLLPSQSDRMLMSQSVEGRYPFLDHRLIDFCNQLHPEIKMAGLNEKWLLKSIMQENLPKGIVSRHKQPYRAPDSASFFNPEPHQLVKDLLNPEIISKYGYFNPLKVSLLVKKLSRGGSLNQKDNMAFVGILSTQLWHKHFIDDYNNHFQ